MLLSSLKQAGDFTLEGDYYLLRLLVTLKFVLEVQDFEGLGYFIEIYIIDWCPTETS